jgi:KDO2-lipid IV(A) lauroyltransferase
MIKKTLKHIFQYPIEFIGAMMFYTAGRVLPTETASYYFGKIIQKVGPLSKAHKTGLKNLTMAFPDMSEKEKEEILAGVWDNFGRVMGEYPSLFKLNINNDPRIEIRGIEHIKQLRDDGKPGIIFGAHLASWEIGIMAATAQGLPLIQLYRATNNPYTDKLVRYVQSQVGHRVLTKGAGDARKILQALKDGEHLFILVDQKMDEGIPVPFFGKDAMTPPAAARLALRLNCPLVPARVERLDGFKFRVTFYPPMDLPRDKDIHEAVEETMIKVNAMIESWVRDRKSQWLWIHRRWPKNS